MKLRALHLTDHAAALLRLARPALTFKPVRAAEEKLVVGETKLGGCPDLPAEARWPLWHKEPLAFLGQFNLGELRATPVCRELPGSGVLSVFYAGSDKAFDNTDKGAWRVFHFPDTSALVRRELPAELDEDHRFKSCRVQFTEILTLPDRDSPWESEHPLAEEENDTYSELMGRDDLGHRLLGYASVLQNDVHGRKNVRHLLTIDSDHRPDWMWGDSGLLYFTIREDHLQQHKFENVRFEMQCC
jgi:uncharacterized protein YwqG